jgi:NitT/TauT family transport system ATP-binding protein
MEDIVIRGLCKRFGEKVVLRDFSAVLPAGACTCIMGQSGCGKTTLLNILMGFLKADSGEITGVPEKKSAIFQEDRLCEGFSAMANLRLVLPKSIPDARLEAHLVELGLADSMRRPVRELSGGMKRRVAIARAMLAESEIVFMDEPLKGLDEKTKAEVIGYMQRHGAGRTILLVTHDREETAAMGGALITMTEEN